MLSLSDSGLSTSRQGAASSSVPLPYDDWTWCFNESSLDGSRGNVDMSNFVTDEEIEECYKICLDKMSHVQVQNNSGCTTTSSSS